MGKVIVEHVLPEFAMLVAFGTAGGTPPPIDPQNLMERSLTVVGGNARIDRAVRLFDAIRTSTLSVPAIERFPLREGAAAHARLEDRAFSGKIVMTSEEWRFPKRRLPGRSGGVLQRQTTVT
jgi:NADPH:quinone reductase-like Zn-dependent oxidoreductase